MRYTKLGRTGLMVSNISLGTVEIGMDYGIVQEGTVHRPSLSESARLLHRALDLGVNFIDTARAYGESENIIGQVLGDRRSEFLLCSKVIVPPSGSRAEVRKTIIESVDTSLQALRTDTLDIMMIHSAPTDVMSRQDVIEVLEDLKRVGKLLWIGASVYGDEAALAAIDSGKFDCLQVAYSVLDRRAESRVWKEASFNDIGIVARSVLLKGSLTSRFRLLPEHLFPLKQVASRLEQLAETAGMSLPELAYRFVLSGPLPHTALVGAASVEEVEAAVGFASAGVLPAELTKQIREIEMNDEKYLNPSQWEIG